MEVFIRSSACVSAQKTMDPSGFPDVIMEYTGMRLGVAEPDYKQYVDPKLLRRMSPVIKRGVAAALQCLRDADLGAPDAIITGTAFGCLEDTITFMTRMVEQQEEMLPPTAFIQSTHNTVAAQIALVLGCHGYNNTFVHKSVSFEHALLDAALLLQEREATHVLAGGCEEMVDASFKIMSRLGLYRRSPVSNLELLSAPSDGTMGGEGSAFFLLSSDPGTQSLARLSAVRTFYKPENLQGVIEAFLNEQGLSVESVDLVIQGRNGDRRNDEIYRQLDETIFREQSLADYKHLCGEYPVSTSFALWLAAYTLQHGTVPPVSWHRNVGRGAPRCILIYNHSQNVYHSLILVSAI